MSEGEYSTYSIQCLDHISVYSTARIVFIHHTPALAVGQESADLPDLPGVRILLTL